VKPQSIWGPVLEFAVLAATRTYLALGFVALAAAWILQTMSHGVLGILAIIALYVLGGGLLAMGYYRYRQLPYPEPARYKKVVMAPLAVIGWAVIAFNLVAAAAAGLWFLLN
jgi:hypothetical protein